MKKIFYTKRSSFLSTKDAVEKILKDYFQISNTEILRTENGKPYLTQSPLFFSVSHTDDALFIAFCDENVGIDAENLDRNVDYLPILRKFHETERKEIRSKQDFLRHFTAIESGVKWLGGTLAKDFAYLRFVDKILYYKETPLPVCVTFKEVDGFILSIVSEKDFSTANIYKL